MSIADTNGIVRDPTSIDTWRTTLEAVIDSVQDCVLEGGGVGGMRYANREYPASSYFTGHLGARQYNRY